MASNSFGTLFRFSTWGESHGPAIGVVIDGCPAGLALDEDAINHELARRAPGSSAHTTRRSEADICRIMSGVFQGHSTGAPISLLIANGDADSSKYEGIAHLLRPGHANYTYLQKYGVFDYRGGGRASARETAGRVAAGAVARMLLAASGIKVSAWLSAAGGYTAPSNGTALANGTAKNHTTAENSTAAEDCTAAENSTAAEDCTAAKKHRPTQNCTATEDYMEAAARYARKSSIFAPDAEAEDELVRRVAEAREDGDSIGGVVSFYASGLPAGLGDPVYEKLESKLAAAMLSIPASRGFEIGAGFAAAAMRGSACNDVFVSGKGGVSTPTNNAGGTLGGISSGMPLYGRVAFKPTPSIYKAQTTVDVNGSEAELVLPEGSRHDPCVAVRAVPVVEAMCLVVLADALLINRSSRL